MKRLPIFRSLTAAALLSLAATASLSAPALAQYYPGGYNNGYNANNNGYDREITGRITSFSSFNLTLQPNANRNRRRGDADDRNNNGRWNNNGGNYNNGNWNGNGNYNNGNWNGNNTDGDRDDQNRNRYGNNGGWRNGLAVHLHQGTIINPTGTTLQPGMEVRILGHRNSDGSFEADRIDVANNSYGRGY